MKQILMLCFLLPASLFSQPELDIKPDNIEFRDFFHRLENVYFINKGDAPLRIDSVKYSYNYYYMRFDYNYETPFFIEPGDSVLMDCILAGYLYVPVTDTIDTVYVYSTSKNGVEDVRVKIDFYKDDYQKSDIYGKINSGGDPVPAANIYFFYDGNYLVDSARTDEFGNYFAYLYPGNYLIAAEKEGFYLTFYGNTPDPFSAQKVNLTGESEAQADITLIESEITPFSVKGKITDSLTNVILKKGLVVVKRGTHTPGKKSNLNFEGEIYSAIVDVNGNYKVKNIISPDYYFIQSFSNYYVPGYYTNPNSTAVFWQNADTVHVNSEISNINIGMLRDSSFGGGKVSGKAYDQSGKAVKDVMAYAQSENSGSIYNFAFAENSGNYNLSYLPYGNYKIIGQRTGFENAYAGPVIIDSINTDTSGINLVFNSDPGGGVKVSQFILKQNYPNPFNPETNFEIIIPEKSSVQFNIYNVMGELVATLYRGTLERGVYNFRFNGKNLSSGTYFAVLSSENSLHSRKILLLK